MEYLPPILSSPDAEMDFPLAKFNHVFKLLKNSNFLQISCKDGIEFIMESTQIKLFISCPGTRSDNSIIVDSKNFQRFTNCLSTSPMSIRACNVFY